MGTASAAPLGGAGFGDRLLQRLAAASGEDDAVAVLEKCEGDGLADAGAGAGDDGDFGGRAHGCDGPRVGKTSRVASRRPATSSDGRSAIVGASAQGKSGVPSCIAFDRPENAVLALPSPLLLCQRHCGPRYAARPTSTWRSLCCAKANHSSVRCRHLRAALRGAAPRCARNARRRCNAPATCRACIPNALAVTRSRRRRCSATPRRTERSAVRVSRAIRAAGTTLLGGWGTYAHPHRVRPGGVPHRIPRDG